MRLPSVGDHGVRNDHVMWIVSTILLDTGACVAVQHPREG